MLEGGVGLEEAWFGRCSYSFAANEYWVSFKGHGLKEVCFVKSAKAQLKLFWLFNSISVQI